MKTIMTTGRCSKRVLCGVACSALFASTLFWFPSPASAYLLNAYDLVGRVDHQTQTPVWTETSIPQLITSLSSGNNQMVAIDAVGHRLFVADSAKNRVLVYTLTVNNAVPDLVPDFVIGQEGFDAVAAGTTNALLWAPIGLAYDATGQRLFVADSGNSRVLAFNLSSGITNGMAAANVLGQTTFTSSTVGLGATRMNIPYGVAYDATGQRLFVADTTSNRILIFNLSSGITNGMAAANVLGQADFTTGTAGVSSTTMANPLGLAYDENNQRLFVAENGNNRVLAFNLSSGITNGMAAANVLGQANFTSNIAGTTSVNFSGVYGVAHDPVTQQLFVADNSNNRVLIFDLSSGVTTGMAAANVLGKADFTGGAPSSPLDALSGVLGVAYTSVGQKLFVVDSNTNRVAVFDLSPLSGHATNGMAVADAIGQPNREQIDHPNGSLIDTAHHRLFVAEKAANRVSVFNLNADNTLSDYRADAVLGQTQFYLNNPSVDVNVMNSPEHLAYDYANDRLFVADTNNSRVLVFNLSSGVTTGMAAANVLGQANFDDTIATTTQTNLAFPRDLIYDAAERRLFVADTDNNRVLIFDLSSGITNGMAASNLLGQANFVSSVSGTSAAEFNGPRGLAYDAARKWLFVSEYNNKRVLIFDLSSGVTNGMAAANVLGQTTFTTVDTTLAPNILGSSYGVAYSSSTNALFVADVTRNAIVVFDVAAVSSGEDAVTLLGQTNFTAADTGTTQSRLFWPYGVHLDEADRRLAVADEENSRVALFQLPVVATSSLPNGTTGQSYSAPITASGGTAPYTCVLSSGALPAGLSFASGCTLSGVPTQSGSFAFVVRAIDSSVTAPKTTGLWADQSFSLTVAAAVVPSVGGGALHIIWAQPPAASSAGSSSPTSSSPAAPAPTSSSPAVPRGPVYVFTRNLSFGRTAPDVRELQTFLNREGFLVALSGAGSSGHETMYFGPATRRALIKFQDAHREEILAPAGIEKGTGFFGSLTRAHVNSGE